MKRNNKIVPVSLAFLMSLFFITSCDKMDDIQRKYADKEEQVYLGKVDSIKYSPGFNRVKLTWYIGSDPKISRTIIYWNMRKDSVVKEFTRVKAGVQKDSIILESLPEGSSLVEFRNVNDRGESSLYSSATINVWGAEFTKGLLTRNLTAFDFDYEQSVYHLTLSPSSVGDHAIHSEIVYKNKHGVEKTERIQRTSQSVLLSDFPEGGQFSFRTVFFPPQGIDTAYSDFKVFRAPVTVRERGVKIAATGKIGSKYFEGNGSELYEWNASGDLILYTVNTDGTINQKEKYASIVPRATYRDFFFYDDDKFIGVTTGNAVSMHQIQQGALVFVKATPTAANTFGTGFTMPRFIPANGFFLSVEANTGVLKTQLAQNNATWGAPNGVTVGTGYHIYEPLMMFNYQSLLGTDSNGYLWATPVSITGILGSKTRIGSGWNRFKKIVNVGTKLLCMEENGDFYVFNNFSTTDKYWIVD